MQRKRYCPLSRIDTGFRAAHTLTEKTEQIVLIFDNPYYLARYPWRRKILCSKAPASASAFRRNEQTETHEHTPKNCYSGTLAGWPLHQQYRSEATAYSLN